MPATADQPPQVLSPNSVLANALLRTIDMIRPKVVASRPGRIVFVVGTQINGAPHLGTNIVQTSAFLLAKLARRAFSVETAVRFSALDNAPHQVTLDPETHRAYQITYFHALGKDGITELIERYYRTFFDSLSDATDTEYELDTYTAQQETPAYRTEFLRSLERFDAIRWWLSPSTGIVHTRLPCPTCGWAEKRAEATRLIRVDDDGAIFTAVCYEHGDYEVCIDPVDGGYLDLATLYRNLIKERALVREQGVEQGVLYVMVKGGDWAFGAQLVDGALLALGTPAGEMPARIFTPMVLSGSGAKLSKSLLRAAPDSPAHAGIQDWILSTTSWPGTTDQYADALIWLVNGLLTDPKHFYRSFTTSELGALMAQRPSDLAARERAREMPIYKRYFDLIASGRKTVEVRVAYPSNKRLTSGHLLRFTCRGEQCLTRIRRVAYYSTFDEMFDHENVAAVNPDASRSDQLASIRLIYPAEKEALGVIAIEVARV
ncbi:MAG: ASCH domain-containing protein [Streptosporangiaceae bacterium]